jgi:hypothetical protein
MKQARPWIATLVAASLTFASSVHATPGALIGTAQVAESQGVVASEAQAQQQRAHVLSYLDRPDVVAGLQERGVSADQARERVAALTDDEVGQLAQSLDSAPAGGIVGAIVFVFVLLLVTDLLGLTKVFPFTRSVR